MRVTVRIMRLGWLGFLMSQSLAAAKGPMSTGKPAIMAQPGAKPLAGFKPEYCGVGVKPGRSVPVFKLPDTLMLFTIVAKSTTPIKICLPTPLWESSSLLSLVAEAPRPWGLRAGAAAPPRERPAPCFNFLYQGNLL